jgi:hypothetical protein
VNTIRAFALDLAERAGSTFVQTFATTVVGSQLTSWAEVKQVAVAGALAGGSAVLSMVKGVVAGTRTGTASLSKVAAALTPSAPVAPAAPQLPAPDPGLTL